MVKIYEVGEVYFDGKTPVPDYDEYRELLDLNVYEKDRKKVMGLEDKVKRLQEQLHEANKLLKYCCANYESSRFGATITEDGEILPKGPVWNYLKKWGVK